MQRIYNRSLRSQCLFRKVDSDRFIFVEISEILELLGRASTDPRIGSALVRFGIHNRPHVKIDMEDPDGPIVHTQDWVINNGIGIEFGFEDEASWFGVDESERGQGSMLLTQIYFYGDHPEVRPYHEHLPFGLQLTDDRRTVRMKLASLEETRRSYIRDTWELTGFRMTVSYVDEGARIGFILCMLRPPPLPIIDNRTAPLPTIDSITSLLGKSWNDPIFCQVLVPQGFDGHLEDTDGERIADFRSTYGFELSFRKSSSISQPSVKPQNGLVLSELVFYRDRDMEACGWKGQLPFGILFDDSPEVMMNKVSVPPEEQFDDKFTGYILWHFPNYSLQVHYSTIENFTLRVRIMATGVWESYQVD